MKQRVVATQSAAERSKNAAPKPRANSDLPDLDIVRGIIGHSPDRLRETRIGFEFLELSFGGKRNHLSGPMKTVLLLLMISFRAPFLLAEQNGNPSASELGTSRVAAPLSPAARARIAQMKPIFDGETLAGWICASNAWTIKDGAMASLGAGRGVVYTQREYTNYRLVFTMRHVSGQPDHQACVLIYGGMPPAGEKGRDALGAIQFQPPNGSGWDYRPGHNNSGKEFFQKFPHPGFDAHQWSQVELLVHTNGTARMAVAQPVGTRAVEVLVFHDPTAGRAGPIAWQMHNKGLFDEYKDVRIEENPSQNRLLTTE